MLPFPTTPYVWLDCVCVCVCALWPAQKSCCLYVYSLTIIKALPPGSSIRCPICLWLFVFLDCEILRFGFGLGLIGRGRSRIALGGNWTQPSFIDSLGFTSYKVCKYQKTYHKYYIVLLLLTMKMSSSSSSSLFDVSLLNLSNYSVSVSVSCSVSSICRPFTVHRVGAVTVWTT